MYKILFFGDSNTYGYDPGSFLGGRYPSSVRWTDRVAAAGEGIWEILPCGMNGRSIPEINLPCGMNSRCIPETNLPCGMNSRGIPENSEIRYLEDILTDAGEIDLFACMLGTNDIFLSGHPDADLAKTRMDAFLTYLGEKQNIGKILLIAPPASAPEQTGDATLKQYLQEAKRLPGIYREIAKKHEVWFADADAWDIPLAHDFVHFTEEGNKIFAAKIIPVLEQIFYGNE